MPVVAVTEAELVGLKARGIRLFAAVAAGENVVAAGAADFTQDCALLIGNEGAGLGQKFIDLADALITIPCPGPVESLNAAIAGSLLLYEASRQRGVSE
jgi:TrmH family RNA methyltransferase